MKKNNKKGFTLAELLIVVAIIAVLVAIAIPVFTSQLEKSREATDVANIRSAYAEVVTTYLDAGTTTSITVAAHQKQQGCQTSPAPKLVYQGGGTQAELDLSTVIGADTLPTSYTVTITIDSNGTATPSVTAGTGTSTGTGSGTGTGTGG